MSTIRLMHAKLHRVTITEANVDYVGSITIDSELINKVGILPLQQVEIWNVTNGNRLSTYVLPGEKNSGVICLNGAAALLCNPGDIAIIVAYKEIKEDEVLKNGHEAKVIIADSDNRCLKFFHQKLVPSTDNQLNFQEIIE